LRPTPFKLGWAPLDHGPL